MRSLEKPNLSNKDWKCPICLKRDEKEVVLVGIVGTEDDGRVEAEQFHLDCIDLIYDKSFRIVFQRLLKHNK